MFRESGALIRDSSMIATASVTKQGQAKLVVLMVLEAQVHTGMEDATKEKPYTLLQQIGKNGVTQVGSKINSHPPTGMGANSFKKKVTLVVWPTALLLLEDIVVTILPGVVDWAYRLLLSWAIRQPTQTTPIYCIKENCMVKLLDRPMYCGLVIPDSVNSKNPDGAVLTVTDRSNTRIWLNCIGITDKLVPQNNSEVLMAPYLTYDGIMTLKDGCAGVYGTERLKIYVTLVLPTPQSD